VHANGGPRIVDPRVDSRAFADRSPSDIRGCKIEKRNTNLDFSKTLPAGKNPNLDFAKTLPAVSSPLLTYASTFLVSDHFTAYARQVDFR